MIRTYKVIVFTLQCTLLLLTSCSSLVDEEINVIDWSSGMVMVEGQTYGQSDKIFRVWDTLSVPPNVTILGNRIEFLNKAEINEGVTLDCNGGELLLDEKFEVLGTAKNPVIINGWTHLSDEIKSNNLFRYTIFNGSIVLDSNIAQRVLELKNCTIKNGSGLSLPKSTLIGISNCSFENNIPYDIMLGDGNVEAIEATNSLEAGICFKTFCSIETDYTLPSYNYTISDGIGVYANLTIKEGTSIVVENDYGITVALGGSIKINGTQENPVTFSGGRYAIRLMADSTGATPQNTISYTNFVENTLSRWDDIFTFIKAGIVVKDAKLKMNNCKIQDYDLWAIQLTEESDLEFNNCTGFNSSHIYYGEVYKFK